jgi:hypothetical protein
VWIFPDALTDRVPKVPEGCLGGFWHFWHGLTLGHPSEPQTNAVGELM